MHTAALLLLIQLNLPGTSSVSVPFAPSAGCAECHAGFDVEGSPHDTWMGSAMAHAARDPWFRAQVIIAERDRFGIGDFCFRCHAPEAWLEGRCLPGDGRRLLPTDTGVGCAGCHRMEPTPYARNGQYVVADEQRVRGPYATTPAPHPTQFSNWISDARLCGTCHDLFNPIVERKNLDGSATGLWFPEQTTYSEWAASDFASEGTTCQTCHLPESPGRNAADGPQRSHRSTHGFAGSNLFLLQSIELLFPEEELHFTEAYARLIRSLESAASIEVMNAPETVKRGQLSVFSARVTNLTGHKLPTGYPEGRRVFVSLRSSMLGMNLGAYDAETDEVHAPWALYETRHGILADPGTTHHVVKNDVVLLDTRIPPRGFVPTATTAPVGYAFSSLPGGKLAHYDDLTLTATIPCDAGPMLDLDMRVWYQSATRQALEPVIASTRNSTAGERLEIVYGAVDVEPRLIRSARVRIPVEGECAVSDAGVAEVADARYVDVGPEDPRDGDASMNNDEESSCDCRSTHRRRSPGTGIAPLAIFALVRSLRRFRIGRKPERQQRPPRSMSDARSFQARARVS